MLDQQDEVSSCYMKFQILSIGTAPYKDIINRATKVIISHYMAKFFPNTALYNRNSGFHSPPNFEASAVRFASSSQNYYRAFSLKMRYTTEIQQPFSRSNHRHVS